MDYTIQNMVYELDRCIKYWYSDRTALACVLEARENLEQALKELSQRRDELEEMYSMGDAQ